MHTIQTGPFTLVRCARQNQMLLPRRLLPRASSGLARWARQLQLPLQETPTPTRSLVTAAAATSELGRWWAGGRQQTTRSFAAAAAAAAGSPTSVRVEEETCEKGGSPYALQGRSGRHTLTADLMPQAGGSDAGPSPKEYVLIALASCTSMTMRIYSDNMIKSGKWPGRTVRKLAVECEELPSTGGEKHLPGGIQVKVWLDSDLDDEQTRRLLAAAGKCPVKRMLKGELKEGITTVLAET